jgi:hypothetical protein
MTKKRAAPSHEQRARDWRAFLEQKGAAGSRRSEFVDEVDLNQAPVPLQSPMLCSQRELGWMMDIGAAAPSAPEKPSLGSAAIVRGKAIAEVVGMLAKIGVAQDFLPTVLRVSHVGRIYVDVDPADSTGSTYCVYRSYQSGKGRIVPYFKGALR